MLRLQHRACILDFYSPDLAYSLNILRKYQGNYGINHWTSVKNILNYLQKTNDMILAFSGKDEIKLISYNDDKFQMDRDNSYL